MIVLSTARPSEPESQANIRRFETGCRILAARVVETVESVERVASLEIVAQNASIGEKSEC